MKRDRLSGRLCVFVCAAFAGLALFMAGCGTKEENVSPAAGEVTISVNDLSGRDTEISKTLSYVSSMELSYADCFAVDYYEGGYTLLTSADCSRVFVVPEGAEVPSDLAKDITVLKRPLNNLYLAGSAAMDFFAALNAVDQISFCSLTADDWYVDAAKAAMEAGTLSYAGKYSAPDYERIAKAHCPLAIENTMITHAPEVIEMLEDIGVQVLMDYSSYETHPFGRMEWVKFYGALLGEEVKAQAVFADAVDLPERTSDEADRPSVAFFYMTSGGLVNVRRTSDYVPEMIALAGGRYLPENAGDPSSGRSTISLQTEQFYADCKDADILIYNASTTGELSSVQDLIDLDEMFASFKAVREGNVYCTRFSLYQQTMRLSKVIRELYAVIHESEEASLETIYRLQVE